MALGRAGTATADLLRGYLTQTWPDGVPQLLVVPSSKFELVINAHLCHSTIEGRCSGCTSFAACAHDRLWHEADVRAHSDDVCS
jgi:hypothetical protein